MHPINQKVMILKILLFFLIPLGALIFVQAISLVRKTFFGRIILEIPFSNKSSVFEISQPGVFTVWQKGQYLRRMPLDLFRPVIVDLTTKKEISLTPSIFRPHSTDGKIIKMEIFRFGANPGKYSIVLAEGKSVSNLEKIISSALPAKNADPDEYYILIRESQPLYKLGIGIFLMIFSVLLMIGGLVYGVLMK